MNATLKTRISLMGFSDLVDLQAAELEAAQGGWAHKLEEIRLVPVRPSTLLPMPESREHLSQALAWLELVAPHEPPEQASEEAS